MEGRVLIRAGKPADEPYVREIARSTFGWGDYVGDAYASWVSDMEKGDGFVYVAVIEPSERVAAVHHSRYLSPEEAWFEGIRVHPDFRYEGIGKKLTIAAIDGARARGIKVCRAAIDGDNFKSQGLASGVGFEPVVAIVQFETDLGAGTSPELAGPTRRYTLRMATRDDVKCIFDKVSKEMSYIGGDNTWWRVTPENIGRVLDDRDLRVAVNDADKVMAGAIVSEICVNEEADNPVLYGEISSPFGSHDWIMSIVDEYARGAAREAADKGLPGKLCVTCEGKSQITEFLREHDFKERFIEGKRDEMWLWELLLAN